MSNKILDKMNDLIKDIQEANYNYYVLDNPTISDKEWDKLYDELKKLETETGIILPYSPTNKVGGDPLDKFEKVKHLRKLMSLDKAQSFEEILDWNDRNQKIKTYKTEFSVEHKFDGLSLALTYENGTLTIGSTRGNGEIGENVTEQVKTIRTVPLNIPFTGKVIIQGEGIMKLSELKKYNQTSNEPLKNARNAAAGAIRNLDPKQTKSRNLDFFAYNINYIEGKNFLTQSEEHQFLIENGFMVDPLFEVVNNVNNIKDIIERIEKTKNSYDFLIDGLVIKINNLKVREELGETQKFPRGMLAYKFEAEETTTILNDVTWQVGRTGKLTPVAELEPVELAGVTVQRATLNNFKDIQRKKVKIGSRVFIRRSNEVIPEILGTAQNFPHSKDIQKPVYCPSCHQELKEGNIDIFCMNHFGCPKQIIERLTHFSSRNAMDITGFSIKTIEQLYNLFNVNSYSDIYRLTAENLYTLESFKDKKVTNILSSIEKSKHPELSRFIYALGIDNVGIKTAKQLARHFKTIEAFSKATIDELVQLNDISNIIASGIVNYFENEYNKIELKNLFNAGVIPKEHKSALNQSESQFSGKKVVLTGTLESLTRPQATEILEKLGAEVVGSVSKNTNYVIVGSDAGSKLDKAIKLAIPTLTEQEFLNLIK